MLLISYDIAEDKLRSKFSKMLMRNGAIRLQYSVYEVANSKRMLDAIKLKIEKEYRTKFTGADSVIIFEVDNDKIIKYGNAIHRDMDVVYL